MTDVKDRIKQKAHDLFMMYGVRSVTMDEIALQAGVSKKTIYQFYADKDELVDAVMQFKIECSEACCISNNSEAENPIHEMFLVIEMIQQMFENMNPTILGDLEKFHPFAFHRLQNHKYNFIYTNIKDNLERGIAAGYYRDDFDIDVIIKLRLETMMLQFNQHVFPSSQYNLIDIAVPITENFLYGIATLKGHKLITKYKQQRNKKFISPMVKNTIKGTVLIIVGLLFFTGISRAQIKNEFSVKQCVEFGLKNSAIVKNALLDVKIQHQTNREITSAALPQLSGSAGFTKYNDIPVQSLPNFISPATYSVLEKEGVKDGNGNTIVMPNGGDFGTIAAQFGVPWTASGGFDLSQLLFDGQVFIGLRARDAAMTFANKNAEITKEQIKANIYKVYYQLVVGNSQLSSLDANIERFQKLLFDTKEIYKNGFAEKLDVDKVQVALNNLNTEKEKIVNQLQVGNAGLKFLMNMPQKDTLILTDSLTEEELKSNILESSYNYNDRKEIQLLTTVSKLNKFNIQRYQLSKLPTIAAFASYSKNAQRQEFNFFQKGEWFTTSLVGVKLSLPIFSGFAKNAKIESARLELQKTQNTLASAKEQIDYEVGNSKSKMKSALLTVDNQKQNVTLAEKVYETTKKKYEQGLGSNTEIYTAQSELKVAQTNYYSALYDAITAKIDFLIATGKL